MHSGSIMSLGPANWQGGRLEGLGTISTSNSFLFTITNPVVISPGQPGDEGGTLTLSGGTQIVMTADDALEIELDARPSVPGGADRLFCNHTITCGGATLHVSLAPGFLPTLGDQYEILRTTIGGSPIIGTFNPVFDVPDGVTFSISYFPQSIRLTVTGTTCDAIDFNNDTSVFDPIDIDAFLSVYGEGDCIPSEALCNDIDFNNDGSVFDPCDIDSFLLVFSEGPCTLCGQ